MVIAFSYMIIYKMCQRLVKIVNPRIIIYFKGMHSTNVIPVKHDGSVKMM